MSASRSRSFLSFIFTVFLVACHASAIPKTPIPAPTTDVALTTSSGKQTAVFAGGCFWGTQSVFERLKGVIKTTAGYSGGSKSTATYNQVTTETTGHAEISRSSLRSFKNHLRPTTAHFLFCGPRSDDTRSSGTRRWVVLSVC